MSCLRHCARRAAEMAALLLLLVVLDEDERYALFTEPEEL